MSFEDGGYTPIFDLFPLQPRRGDISVEHGETPISEPRRGDIYNFDKIFTHPEVPMHGMCKSFVWLFLIELSPVSNGARE